MKTFSLIVCLAVICFLTFAKFPEPVSPMVHAPQPEARRLATPDHQQTASTNQGWFADTQPMQQRDGGPEPGTILLFGTGLIALTLEWRYRSR